MINNTILVSNEQTELNNGIIREIHQVIPLPTIVSALQNDLDFSIFLQALTRSDLGDYYLETLNHGIYTIFAPTNAAFTALLSELGYANLNAIPTNTLNDILQYHILKFNLRLGDFAGMQELITLGSKPLSSNGSTLIDSQGRIANLVTTDIQTTTGVLHSIDKVLIPL